MDCHDFNKKFKSQNSSLSFISVGTQTIDSQELIRKVGMMSSIVHYMEDTKGSADGKVASSESGPAWRGKGDPCAVADCLDESVHLVLNWWDAIHKSERHKLSESQKFAKP
eukprot:gnl/MRDRNA2_/MRDRNA2_81008_c0_seq1.p1 gnl/MRDRNA2_/MRDRNA2_81008_c0~~gnl/MRDRNA2_/MRDRNA2_81008_c0_seq1.p1  ORF type:complete len:111 (-),score=18.70 gnl/MRDRNA2_/MRDRNA2_81008_c0_seq1:169-501(-)